MSKFNIRRQINSLYASSVFANLSLTGAWVALLSARGFSLPEVGIAEAVFHLTSLIWEIPSGVLADVFGRKKMLIISSILHAIANVVMILSTNLFWVCVSISFHAMCYNFSSGSGEALAFDSLKSVSQQDRYDKYLSNQMIIYRLLGGLSTLCAGFALFVGHRIAYGVDIVSCIIQIVILSFLTEIGERMRLEGSHKIRRIRQAIFNCFRESFRFMRNSSRAFRLMFFNSLVGSFDILLAFFIQAKFPEIGVNGLFLGIILFVIQLGGIMGSWLTVRYKKISYGVLYFLCLMIVLTGVVVEHTGIWYVMMIGGFIATLGDDALQVRTNSMLQEMFPSEQRATLISIDSFIFSMIMIVLSPLAGFFFSVW